MYALSTFNEMLDNNVIHLGQPLFFKYTNTNGEDFFFDAVITNNGLNLEHTDATHTPSSAASVCIYKNTNDRIPVNGWLTWTNDEGLSLTQLYLRYKKQPYKHLKADKLSEVASTYNLTRDVAFIFGAGISMADGAPSQAQILDRMYSLSNKKSTYKDRLNEIMLFLKHAFDYENKKDQNAPSLEYIFGFIDFFLSLNQSYTKYYTTQKLQEVREDMVRFINHFIHEKINPESEDMNKFIDLINTYNSNISILTLNYDTLFEDSFNKFTIHNLYLSFCYDLINFSYQFLSPDSWLIDPDKAMILPSDAKPKTIKFLKLHGSLNWFYCNVCNSLMIKPRYKKKLSGLENDDTKLEHTTTKVLCPKDQCRMLSLTTPPAYKKDLTHPVISKLLIEASSEINISQKIVFIGYSMPEADVHIKAILSRAGTKNRDIFVINPFMDSSTKNRYQQLNKNVTFIEKTFGAAIADGDIKRILQKNPPNGTTNHN